MQMTISLSGSSAPGGQAGSTEPARSEPTGGELLFAGFLNETAIALSRHDSVGEHEEGTVTEATPSPVGGPDSDAATTAAAPCEPDHGAEPGGSEPDALVAAEDLPALVAAEAARVAAAPQEIAEPIFRPEPSDRALSATAEESSLPGLAMADVANQRRSIPLGAGDVPPSAMPARLSDDRTTLSQPQPGPRTFPTSGSPQPQVPRQQPDALNTADHIPEPPVAHTGTTGPASMPPVGDAGEDARPTDSDTPTPPRQQASAATVVAAAPSKAGPPGSGVPAPPGIAAEVLPPAAMPAAEQKTPQAAAPVPPTAIRASELRAPAATPLGAAAAVMASADLTTADIPPDPSAEPRYLRGASAAADPHLSAHETPKPFASQTSWVPAGAGATSTNNQPPRADEAGKAAQRSGLAMSPVREWHVPSAAPELATALAPLDGPFAERMVAALSTPSPEVLQVSVPVELQATGIRDAPDLPTRVTRQLAATVVATGNGTAELALAPEELGQVRMSIRQEDGVTLIHIIADRPETADLMRRHADLLLRDLSDSGLGSARLSFGDGGGQNGRSPQRQDGTGGRSTGTPPGQPAERPQHGNPPHSPAPGRSLDMRL